MAEKSSIRIICHEKTEPISIPIKLKEPELIIFSDPFSVSTNTFDPSKFSPPNLWNIRLSKRVEQYFQNPEKESEEKNSNNEK